MTLFNKASTKPTARGFVIGRDHDQPVKVLVQPIPAGVDRDLRRRSLGDVKSRRAGSQPLARQLERTEDFIAERAAYALVDTKNFYLGVQDQPAVDRYAPLLKRELKPGEEVLLDGAWTDEVKRAFLEDFPRFADKVSDLADSITHGELEEEEEATEAF